MTKTVLEPTVVTKKNSQKEADTSNWWAKTVAPPAAKADEKHKILQTINFNLGSFDDKNRTFLAIASSACVDRQGDVIVQDGWDLANFKNNPVIPWAHDYWQPPVARAVEIGVSDGVLQFVCQFPPEGLYPFADTIWNLYRNGYMFAFSVGFIPEEPEEGWQWEGNTFRKCELLEISAVVVPANPQALALAAKAGVIDPKQTKQLISKLEHTVVNLQDILKAQEQDDKAADTEVEEPSAVALVRSLLVEAGLLPKANEEAEDLKDLTDDKGKIDNESMGKKDLGESNGGDALTPTQHAGTKEVADAMCAVADVLGTHSKALAEHAATMKAHSDLVQEKADLLLTHAKALQDLLKDEDSVSDADETLKSTDTSSTAKSNKDVSTKDVDGEVNSDSDDAADADKADDAEVKEDVKSDDAKADEAEEEEAAAGTEGADQEAEDNKETDTAEADASKDADVVKEELFDPENLDDAAIEKILVAVNEKRKQQK
jgi:hypothetical protein